MLGFLLFCFPWSVFRHLFGRAIRQVIWVSSPCLRVEKNELVDGDEHVQLAQKRGVGARGVDDAGATHRALTTYGFGGAQCPLMCSSGDRCGLDVLEGASLASPPPEATRPRAIAHVLLQKCCR